MTRRATGARVPPRAAGVPKPATVRIAVEPAAVDHGLERIDTILGRVLADLVDRVAARKNPRA
jgi:hypothetical protein